MACHPDAIEADALSTTSEQPEETVPVPAVEDAAPAPEPVADESPDSAAPTQPESEAAEPEPEAAEPEPEVAKPEVAEPDAADSSESEPNPSEAELESEPVAVEDELETEPAAKPVSDDPEDIESASDVAKQPFTYTFFEDKRVTIEFNDTDAEPIDEDTTGVLSDFEVTVDGVGLIE